MSERVLVIVVLLQSAPTLFLFVIYAFLSLARTRNMSCIYMCREERRVKVRVVVIGRGVRDCCHITVSSGLKCQ